MKIEKCRWKYGKQAPVMFMIDDFANKYMTDKNGGDYVGADWGGRCKAPHSLYRFCEQNIFREFPYVKMTLFLVVGSRAAIIADGKPSVSHRIDEDAGFARFLKELACDERFEIAYHGYTHGKPLENGFIQEWAAFTSVEEACRSIEMCKEIYRHVTGSEFNGGKYCGYTSNAFSDTSIAKTGFEWWCRHYDASLYTNRGTGVESLDLEEFQGVVDIPSTVDGSLTSLQNVKGIGSRSYLKALYYLLKYRLTIERILDRLVQNGQVINIQEHSSPMREDDKRQKPNLIDDIGNIQYMLRYLQKYDLWYATGHEIAEYWKTYRHTTVSLNGEQVAVSVDSPEYVGKSVWLALSNRHRALNESTRLITDTGESVAGTKSGQQMLFEVKYTQQREVFSVIGGG